MQNSKASGQFHDGLINFSLLALLKSKGHIRGVSVMSVLPRNPFLRHSWFLNPLFGIHFFGIRIFGIHFFGIHFSESIFSEFIFFRMHFLSESIFSEFVFLDFFCRISFFSEFIFGTWANTRKIKFRKMVVCPFCLETVKISDFIFSEPPILAFLICFGLWGGSRLHLIFGGWFGGVGCWQLNWVWLGFWDFDRECLRVCLEVLQNYDPRAEGTQYPIPRSNKFMSLDWGLFFECMVLTLHGIIDESVSNNMSVSVKHTSWRSKSEVLVQEQKNVRDHEKTNKVLRGFQGVQQPSVKLKTMCWRPG